MIRSSGLRSVIVASLTLPIVLASLLSPLTLGTVHADSAYQATIGMPFSGKWAYSQNVNPPYTDSNSSHPSVHATYGADWATDLYALNTNVKAIVTSNDGTVSLAINSVTNNCSLSDGSAGKRVQVKVTVGSSVVGYVSYEHLDTTLTSGSSWPADSVLGKTRNWGNIANCYVVDSDSGVHTHVSFTNYTHVSDYACYTDNGHPGADLSQGDALGQLGHTGVTSTQQACAAGNSGGTSDGGTLWGINTSNQAVLYDGNGVWGTRGGPAMKAISSDGTTVVGVSTSGETYIYLGSSQWHHVSGASLIDAAEQSGTIWGINTSNQIVKYVSNGNWSLMGGPASIHIQSDGTNVIVLSTTGVPYTYVSGTNWHSVSGATLIDVAETNNNGTLWGVNTSGQAVRYVSNGNWITQGGPAFQSITANGSDIVALTPSGKPYIYTSNSTWHSVSGATLIDVADQ